jgi:hypothetical protein
MNAVEYCLLHGLKLAGPEHPAILCAQESLSYGALAARVSQFAAGLREAGIRSSDRVAMMMLDTPDLIALDLGVMAGWRNRSAYLEPRKRHRACANSCDRAAGSYRGRCRVRRRPPARVWARDARGCVLRRDNTPG